MSSTPTIAVTMGDGAGIGPEVVVRALVDPEVTGTMSAVVVGDAVRKGQKLLTMEAMKMETTLYAERPGRVAEVFAAVGQQVKTGDLLIRLKEE